MSIINGIKALYQRLTAMDDLHPEHTAIMFHWPQRYGEKPLPDMVFMLDGLLHGEVLHQTLDALLEEHAPHTDGSADVLTEVTLFWHYEDGHWDSTELCSHYYPAHNPHKPA